MQAVLVISPDGGGLRVSQVVLDAGQAVWVQDARGPVRSKRVYTSLAEAVEVNDRATTTALEMGFATKEEALQTLGREPPLAGRGDEDQGPADA